MRVFLIAAGLVVVLAAAGFIYLLSVAETMGPAAGPQTIDVDVEFPR